MLVSKPSRRNRRAGITGPILLIPEFCRETGRLFSHQKNFFKRFFSGISDSMRNDFNLMKELASHTHIDPTPRYQSLLDMVNTINTYEARELGGENLWHLICLDHRDVDNICPNGI